jgi:hypothetical protein
MMSSARAGVATITAAAASTASLLANMSSSQEISCPARSPIQGHHRGGQGLGVSARLRGRTPLSMRHSTHRVGINFEIAFRRQGHSHLLPQPRSDISDLGHE